MEGFWDFSVRTYRSAGVHEACLSLQDDYGADVNMLLYCCWIGGNFGPYDDELFRQAIEFSKSWCDEVVARLRSARTWMKLEGCAHDLVARDACMELREDIKTVEFAAEKMQQELLASLVSEERAPARSPDRVITDVVANLMRYAHHVGTDISVDLREKLAVIVSAAFPACAEDAISRALAA